MGSGFRQPQIAADHVDDEIDAYLADQVDQVTASSVEAQKALERLDADPEPDAMVLDVLMPGMDGLEVVRRMRDDSHVA